MANKWLIVEFCSKLNFFDWLPSSWLTSIIAVACATGGFIAIAFCKFVVCIAVVFASWRLVWHAIVILRALLLSLSQVCKMSCTCSFASLQVASWLQFQYTGILCNRSLELAAGHDRFCRWFIAIAFAIGRRQNIAVAFYEFTKSLRSLFVIHKSIMVAFASTQHCCNCILQFSEFFVVTFWWLAEVIKITFSQGCKYIASAFC